jgi:hypothetical protein
MSACHFAFCARPGFESRLNHFCYLFPHLFPHLLFIFFSSSFLLLLRNFELYFSLPGEEIRDAGVTMRLEFVNFAWETQHGLKYPKTLHCPVTTIPQHSKKDQIPNGRCPLSIPGRNGQYFRGLSGTPRTQLEE